MALKDLVVHGPMPKQKIKNRATPPIHIDETSWMYPLREGLVLVHEMRDRDRLIRSDTITIKWVDVGIAMERRKALRRPYPKNRRARA